MCLVMRSEPAARPGERACYILPLTMRTALLFSLVLWLAGTAAQIPVLHVSP